MPRNLSADVVRAALAAMKPRPSVEMYPGDWLRDPIAGCSLAANGFWWRATMVMHDAKPYGHMVANNGTPLTPQQIVQRCGCKSVAELRKVIAEIEAFGIPGRTGDADYLKILDHDPIVVHGSEWKMDLSPLAIEATGVMYSRRMLRDRILSLVRFFVSPKGQDLIGSLSTQKLDFVRTRAGDQKEEEEEVEESLVQEPNDGKPASCARELTAQQRAVQTVQQALAGRGMRREPQPGQIVAWLRDFGDAEWIAAVIADVGPSLDGRRPEYLHAILRDRRMDGWQPRRPKAAPLYVEPAHDPEPRHAEPIAEPNAWTRIVEAVGADELLSRAKLIEAGANGIVVGVESQGHIDAIRDRHAAAIKRARTQAGIEHVVFEVVAWKRGAA